MRSYGQISIRLNGLEVNTRGNFDLEPGHFTKDAVGHHNGRVAITSTPQPPRLKTSFERADWVWADDMMGWGLDITVREDSNGRTHIITDGRFVGRASVSATDGQVTGIEVTWDKGNYQVIGG